MSDLAKQLKSSSVRSWMALAALGLTLGPAAAQFDGPAPLAWRWYQSTSVPPGGTPVVDNGTVFIAVGSRAYALDKESGNQRWRFPIGEPLAGTFRTGVLLSDGIIVAAADNKVVYGLDAATGSQKWTYSAPEAIVGAPVVVGKFVVVGLSDNSFMALNISDGKPVYANPERIFNGILGGMASYGGNVLVMDRSFNLYSIDIASRKVNWKTPFSFAAPDGKPVVYGDTIYINTGAFLTAVRAGNGQGVWQKNVGDQLAFSPAVSPSGIFVVTRNGRATAFDLGGRPINRTLIDLQALPVQDPAPAGKLFTVPTSNGSINLVDPSTGSVVWNFIVRPITSYLPPTGTSGSTGGGLGQSGGARGGGGGQTTTSIQNYVVAASAAVLNGKTLLVLTKDGSLLAFDRQFGVDLTAPNIRMFFPMPGDTISGQPPLEFAFKIEDEASGLNPATVKVDIDGNPVDFVLTRDGILSFDISSAPMNTQGKPNKNLPLADGRRTLSVTATDWMGNSVKQTFTVVVDNALRPLGRSGQTDKKDQGTGGKGGGGGVSGGG